MGKDGRPTIRICAGLGGVMSGSEKVMNAFKEALDERGLDASVTPLMHKVGCLGLCARDVLVEVELNGDVYTYQHVTSDMVEEIVEAHLIGGRPVKEWLTDGAYDNFHRHQQKVLLKHLGRIDPESLEAYRGIGGYEAARRALGMTPEEVIQAVKNSGLRGRGGAGFPTGLKWDSCRRSPAAVKYVLCNADEGDPGAFMDRAVLEGNPHAVIEGMIIGAHAVGGTHGYVYVRAEYPLAVERLRNALSQAREKGFLGKGIFGRNFDFDIRVFLGAGAFVCGEETALMASMEDKPGEPKLKYVFPTEKGLWDQPTVLNNVETWANIPAIIREGAEWYAGFGTEKSKGTKLFSLAGKINNTGLIEVPMGTPLRRIIYDIGGGIPGGKELKAVQMGGPSGGCIPASLIDIPVDYESVARAGSIIGSGGMIVLDQDTCMVDMAKYFVSFCAMESCGQCTPCREGLRAMEAILTDITQGRGREEHLKQLEELADVIIDSSLCGLGKTAPNPVKSTLRYFRDEYIAHIRDKHCPAGVCKRLVPAPCQAACPAGIDVPSYVALIAQGRYDEAVDIIREDNPFPWVCGLVCPAPCETRCQRGAVDSPISIRALKGFAAKAAIRRSGRYTQSIKTRRRERIAIVGSGPAGLSAAYYLAVEGYHVTIFEALPQAGGMLRVGIPAYRLPREVLDKEIDNIRNLGVEVRTSTPIGPELTIQDLFDQGYRAVFLSTGAHKSARLAVPGEDAEGVVHGVTYLRRLSLEEPVPDGHKVLVIGGGNAAIDAARSALRKGAERVTILYRRTRQEMPAYESEIEDTLQEGIAIRYLVAPREILVRDGKVVGLRCIRMELGEPDASGRRRPVPVPGSKFEMEADLVIPTIGQFPDMGFAQGFHGLQTTARGTIQADPHTLATTVEGIFAGGDMVSGPATVIQAITAGKKAAVSIDAFVRGVERPKERSAPLRRATVERTEVPERLMEQLKRPKIPTLPMQERKTTFEQVEIGLTEKMARDEGRRCLRCDLS